LAQLNTAEFDIFSAEFGDEVLCVRLYAESVSTPAAALPAGVSTKREERSVRIFIPYEDNLA